MQESDQRIQIETLMGQLDYDWDRLDFLLLKYNQAKVGLKADLAAFGQTMRLLAGAEYGRIIPEPVNTKPLSAVHEKLEALGISEADAGDAVKWSRG